MVNDRCRNCLGDIRFTPPLQGARARAVKFAHHNKGAKLHFKLDEVQPLWLCTVSTKNKSPYLMGIADHNGTKTSGADGTYVVAATKNDSISDTKDARSIVSGFEKCFKLDGKVGAYLSHDWATDPFSKGLWSCYRSQGMSEHLVALQQPHELVFFASADWANGWRGFIDGALESGKNDAKSVASLLEKTTLETRI